MSEINQTDEETVVIIGASHASLSCAEALRINGFEGDIIVCERDDGLPLECPPLTKTYFDADVTDGDDNFLLRRLGWFTQFDIKFLEQCALTKIERTKKIVFLASNQVLSYDKLVIASGAVARKLRLTGDSARGVHVLQTANDASGLRDSLRTSQNAVVIGGGCI